MNIHCEIRYVNEFINRIWKSIFLQKNAAGAEVYEQVFYSLDLEERDYFGLQFTDHYNVQV